MKSIDQLLPELTSRLPELEWKMSRLHASFSSHRVPRGLFRSSQELTGSLCVEEIKEDIAALSIQKNERSALYLAERIQRKITVLVTLCKIDTRRGKLSEKAYFGINMLSTRQQWLNSLETEITHLEQQHQAMEKALEQMQRTANTDAVLKLKAELGEIEKRVTLAKETLSQATFHPKA